MRTPRLILPAILVALALSACGGGGGDPTPEPSVTSTPEPTESPTPEPDPSTIAARIHVQTNSVLVFAQDDSQLADFTVYDPASEVVAELTEVFGTDPAVSDSAGGLETAPSRTYDWSGFSIIDYEGLTIMNSDFIVAVQTAAVGDIQVYTYFDLQVGSPMADAYAVASFDTGFPDYTAIGSIPVGGASVGEPGFSGLAIYVGVSGSGGTISSFAAPSPNWGV
ncbi:MAG: hypothetical protein ABL886_02980 [Rhodoglobus sp.]